MGSIGRRARRAAVFTAAAMALGTGSAAAAAPAVNVGTPHQAGAPAVAVDAAGTAVLAWANTQSGGSEFVQYCVLPAGAHACTHTGNLVPAGGNGFIDGTQVLVDGSTLVILADVFGSTDANGGRYLPEQEWQSTDGGATWVSVNGGVSPTSARVNADTVPVNAVILPGTGVLGYGWETAAGAPTFNAFPLTAPAECSETNPCPFATLEPSSNPDVLGNLAAQFASQSGAQPGVLGVFATQATDGGPFSCASNDPFGVAFAYGAGNQGATSDYNVSPGSAANSAWTGPAQMGECGVEYFAIAGGPSGFGLIARTYLAGTTVYQRFDPVRHSFGPKTQISGQPELNPALSQDGAGNLYATFFSGGSDSPLALAYSADHGATWSGPATLDGFNSQQNPTSAVSPSGQGWVTWLANGSVYAQPFTAADAVSAPSASPSASTNGSTLAVTVSCSSLPCTVTITITAPPAGARDARAKKRTPVVLAAGRFTIRAHKSSKLTLRLTGAGRTFFRRHHGTVGVKAALSETVHGRAKTRSRTLRVKVKAKR